MKTVRILCALAAVSCVTTSWPAFGQRVQFATPLTSQATATPGATAPSASPTFAPATTTSPYPGPVPAPSSYPPPPLGAPGVGPAPAFGPTGTSTPAFTPPPAYGATPAFTPPPTYGATPAFTPPPAYGAAPAATFNGGIQPPPANWDPYATPTSTPSALLPQDPYFQSGTAVSMGAMTKFMQRVYLDYHWFAGNGKNQLGINDIGIGATFSLPLFRNIETPFLITPGFGLHLWQGPVSLPPDPADMPSQTYDAFLDTAWAPQLSCWFGADLAFRIGVYSDFSQVNSNSIRYTGRALAVIGISPSVKLKGGIFYLDRVRVKMLPAGGIIWTPNPDIYFNILFPNPKIAKRLTTVSTTEWWIYAAGDYGGGTWTVKRESGLLPPVLTDGTIDTVDYNDIRISGGLEFKGMRQFTGYFEVGLSCSRELVYESGLPPTYYPSNTVYLGAGMAY